MAEGSRVVHTCPATCLHHRARAGCDSVCQCLQWSDYEPVLRHVQFSSVCLLSSAAVYICLPGWGCRDDTSAWVGSTETHTTSLLRHVHISNKCKGTFHISSYPSICQWCCCSHSVLQLWKEGKGKRRKKIPCAVQTQFCMQYRRAPMRRGGGGGKGCGGSQ